MKKIIARTPKHPSNKMSCNDFSNSDQINAAGALALGMSRDSLALDDPSGPMSL